MRLPQWSVNRACWMGRSTRKRRLKDQIAEPARGFPAEKSVQMSPQQTIAFSKCFLSNPVRLDKTMLNQPTLGLSATMGDYPTSHKRCPESDGIKLVSCFCAGQHFVLLRLVGSPHMF